MSTPFWICAAVTAISAYVSLGFSLVGLRTANGPEAWTASSYALARSVALAGVASAALLASSVPFLVAVASAMVLVQAADAVVGASVGDRWKTVGPAATAVANLAALLWLAAQ